MSSVPILAITLTASAAVTAERLVSYAGAVSVAGAAGPGVVRQTAASGELVTVDVLGTSIVASGAAVAVGDAVESDASGRAIPKTTGVTRGRALTAATAADQRIEVLLIPN